MLIHGNEREKVIKENNLVQEVLKHYAPELYQFFHLDEIMRTLVLKQQIVWTPSYPAYNFLSFYGDIIKRTIILSSRGPCIDFMHNEINHALVLPFSFS